MTRAQQNDPYQLTVDLEQQVIKDSSQLYISFSVNDFQRSCLLEGSDDIGLTLKHEEEIRAYETNRRGAALFSKQPLM